MFECKCALDLALFAFLSFSVSGALSDQAGNSAVIITISYGKIKGLKTTSPWTNKAMFYFKGIPYATPPIGELRFKDPVPPEKWSEVKDCTREQSVCHQIPTIPPAEPIKKSEDCLYLNVYTPKIEDENGLPVVVWIHLGAFMEGSGNHEQNGPDFLVGEGVIVVTINHRLGALGFLTLGTIETPGNSGLKDQILALKWVQSEIQHFGGDPRKVTLFGESSGSIAIHLHYLSPLSVGLFHRAIGDSGSALAYRVRENGHQYGLSLAQVLNCSSENIDSALRCLKTADAEAITKAQFLVKAPLDDISGLLAFGPTIDKETSKEPFIPDYPINLVKQKTGSMVPFLMGFNSDEGMIRLFRSEEEIRNITNNLEYLYALQVPESHGCSQRLKSEKIKEFYFKNSKPSEKNYRGYVDVYTDVLYAYSTLVSARTYQNRAEVFLYYFAFSGKFKEKYVKNIEKKYNISGVSHCEELNYIFVNPSMNEKAEENSNEIKTLRRMVKMWTNFAKYGKPTTAPDPELQSICWEPASGGKTNHLHIGTDLKMIFKDLLPSRTALWDDIYSVHCS